MKRIICSGKLIIVFLFLLMIIPKNTLAEVSVGRDASTECTNYIQSMSGGDGFISKYGLSSGKENGNFVIKMNHDKMSEAAKKQKDKIKFKVAKIIGFDTRNPSTGEPNPAIEVTDTTKYIQSSNKVLTYSDNSIAISFNEIDKKAHNGYEVILEPDFSDTALVKHCGKEATFDLAFFGTPSGYVAERDADFGDAEVVSPIVIADSKKMIDCNQIQTTAFNKAFCDARAKAIAANGDAESDNTVQQTYQCDVKKTNYEEGGDYYVNKSYLRKTKEIPQEPLNYVYGYTCGSSSDTYSVGSCDVKCEEVVTIEYGPPVASKAGLCFEYKVQVTSRVTCGVVSYPQKPTKGKVCTPEPDCTDGSVHHKQGGPNEEYDTCIKSCDGGAYSDRCTNQCYKQVYGSTLVRRTYGDEIAYTDKLDSSTSDVIATKVADGSTSGKLVYFCKDDSIYWDGGQNTNTNNNPRNVYDTTNDSRWHNTHSWGIEPLGDYKCTSGTGIPRRCDCGETCTWLNGSCTDIHKSYMNDIDVLNAYNANMTKYNEYVAKCEAVASCSTKTATFTISSKVNGTTYEFPYSKEPDVLTYKGNKKKEIILEGTNNGCYSDTEGEKITDIWYQAAWSFPATYIHNKTGEISYETKTDDTGWQKMKEKFCLPLNAENVNKKWWNYYYTKLYGNASENPGLSIYTDDYKSVCPTSTIQKVTNISESDIEEWNINAITKNFGHNDWNIKVQCFYALNKEETVPPCPTDEPLEKRVRSVDLANLFPAPDGSDTSRTAGFNWTASASNTIKDNSYKSLPSAYAQAVQAKEQSGQTVFDDDSELDYEIILTKVVMQNIKGKEYTNYPGNMMNLNEVHSVLHYKSDLVHNIASKSPTVDAIKCNNIINRNSCDTSITG